MLLLGLTQHRDTSPGRCVGLGGSSPSGGASNHAAFPEEGTSRRGPLDGRRVHGPPARLDALDEELDELLER